MKTITDSFNTIIAKQKELGYHMSTILNPPAGEQDITAAEDALNFKLNDELKELYTLANGICNDYNTPSGCTGLIPIHNFLSLPDAIVYYRTGIGIESYFTHYETRFKPGVQLFPFLEDGAGNCYWVDLNTGTENENKIFWTNTFGENPDYLYESLTNLWYTIAESYQQNLFSVDEEGYLNLDYNRFDEMSALNNQTLPYWNK